MRPSRPTSFGSRRTASACASMRRKTRSSTRRPASTPTSTIRSAGTRAIRRACRSPTTSRATASGTATTPARVSRAANSTSGRAAKTPRCPRARSSSSRWSIVKVGITDNVSFQYLLGHTYSDTRQYNDWDAGEFNFYIDYFLNELDLTSHEFQFSGGGDRFSWVGGAYLWDQEGRGRNPAYSMADWVEATPNYPERHAGVLVCESGHAERGVHDGDSGVARHHELAAARRRGLRAAVRARARRQQRQRLAVRL